MSGLGLLCAAVAELSSCDRHHMAYKAKSIYCLTLYEKVCQPLLWMVP